MSVPAFVLRAQRELERESSMHCFVVFESAERVAACRV